MPKIIVNASPVTDEKAAKLVKKVADALGVLESDVVIIPGAEISIVDIPSGMTAARQKKDKEDEAAAEKKAAEEKTAAEATAKPAPVEPPKPKFPTPMHVKRADHEPKGS